MLQTIFELTPLTFTEWLAVFKMAFPVIILDEILKFVARSFIEGIYCSALTANSFSDADDWEIT